MTDDTNDSMMDSNYEPVEPDDGDFEPTTAEDLADDGLVQAELVEPDDSGDYVDDIAYNDVADDEFVEEAYVDPEAYLDTLVEPVELPTQTDIDADTSADSFIDDLLAGSAVAAAGERLSRSDDDADNRPVYTAPTYTPGIALPSMATLRRGRLGSVVPALALIGIGAWLTLTLSSGSTVETPLLLAVVLGAIVISMLAQWLGSGRWSRGNAVTALVIVAIVALFIVPLLPGMLPFSQIFPLLAAALGIALIVSGLIVRPAQTRALVPGLLLIVMGVAGTLLTTGVLPAEIGTTLAPLWAIPVVILLAIWLVPLVFRRRRGS